MANYISQTDIENVFGTENVKYWSDLDDSGSVDTTRISKAIEFAEAAIDDWFRDSEYEVPITGVDGSTPSKVIDWAAKYAGYWLYSSRGLRDVDDDDNKIARLKREVDDEIRSYLSGQRRLNAEIKSQMPNSPFIVSNKKKYV